jgi:hypothetical protein
METGGIEYSGILSRLLIRFRNQLTEKSFGFAGAAAF